MTENRIRNDYFEWLLDIVCSRRFSPQISYRRLLNSLHSTEFSYSIPMDANRAYDGIDLRSRFTDNINDRYSLYYLCGPCSVLEMMVALSIRCEENIMDDPLIGDRTQQWFWEMISNMGLKNMTDDIFDELYVTDVINRFINREYEPDGNGGLFRIKHCMHDLRKVEIWYQLCWYLDYII